MGWENMKCKSMNMKGRVWSKNISNINDDDEIQDWTLS